MPLFLDRRVYRRSFHSTGAHSKVDKVLYMKEQSEAHTTGGFVVTFIAARHILISSRATHGKSQAPLISIREKIMFIRYINNKKRR